MHFKSLMTPFIKYLLGLAFTCNFCLLQIAVFAQKDTIPNDTIPKKTLNDYIRNKKGFLVKVVKSFMRDSTEVERVNDLKRNNVLSPSRSSK